MAKVWNMDNRVKFDPADVTRWMIYDPGEFDHNRKKRLTHWQVTAMFEQMATIYVGYYGSEEEAVKAVDTLDAMKRDDMLDTDAEPVEEEIT